VTPPHPSSVPCCFLLAAGLCLLVGCSVFPDVPPIKSDPIDTDAAADGPDAADVFDVANGPDGPDGADAADVDASQQEASRDAPVEADSEDSFEAGGSDVQDAADSSDAMDAVDGADSSDAPDSEATADADDGGHCSNGVTDGDETDLNCGGLVCPRCAKNQHCLVDSDCQGTCNQSAHKCK
jgi:hypothetical protein